jgi:hypothetical protein
MVDTDAPFLAAFAFKTAISVEDQALPNHASDLDAFC